jgi:hypothetical protein
MGNKSSKKKRIEKEEKKKGKDKGKKGSTKGKDTSTTNSTTFSAKSTPSSPPAKVETKPKPQTESSSSEDNGATVADILCEDAHKEAAARGHTKKVSKDDFDILSVIGRGSFGKVECSGVDR